ncbi:MAG: FAD-dependent oxidoreductase, partial [Myxococcales bacterium]|nr:FAD-dependent oxidoreductase [Myxococcales bacterium]
RGAIAGSLLAPSFRKGHAIRDGLSLEPWRGVTPSRTGTLILGGGPAGLSAAWRLLRRGYDDFALYELEPKLGGTSLSGASAVSRYPWAAHYLPLPMADNTTLIALLRELGAVTGTDSDGEPIGAEQVLVQEPAERVFFRGYWYPGVYPFAGASAEDLRQLERFRRTIDGYVAMRDGRGRRAFTLPVSRCSDDPDLRALDRLSARAWLDAHGFTSARLRWLALYACRDDYSLGLDEASAWALIFYWAARIRRPGADAQPVLTWPEGNGALVHHLAAVTGARAHTGHLAVDVEPTEAGVRARLLRTADDAPVVIDAERCVVATPRFTAARIVRPLRQLGPPSLEGFRFGAWAVANLHLRSRPGERGFEPCWDNVLHHSRSVGYVDATHQGGRGFGPTVWTYYRPLWDYTPAEARAYLLEASWEDWRDAILRDLAPAHPDLVDHVERIDVYRWGHAMIQPRAGFVWSEARTRAAAPLAGGRIHFAHSDLSALALFEEAFDHGVRAADAVLASRAVAPPRPPG